MLGTRLTLDDDLTTTATGTAGLFQQFSIRASGGNGEGRDSYIRILGTCGEKSRTLGTKT